MENKISDAFVNELYGSALYFLLVVAFVILSLGSTSAQQIPSQDPGHKEDAEIARVQFSVPKSFTLGKSSDSRVAVMRHDKYDLALFVAVPDKRIDEPYLTDISKNLATQLLPHEDGFAWKIVPGISGSKVSKYQTSSGNTKGFNGKKFVQIEYKILRVKDREVVVGYITKLGQDSESKFLFDSKGPAGFSMPGWYAEAHIIASVTGERYEEINPGTVFKGTPIKKSGLR